MGGGEGVVRVREEAFCGRGRVVWEEGWVLEGVGLATATQAESKLPSLAQVAFHRLLRSVPVKLLMQILLGP